MIIVCAIIVSIVIFILNADPNYWGQDSPTLFWIEVAVVIVFTLDYIGRLLLTPFNRWLLPHWLRCSCLGSGETGFVWQFMNQIDFWSVFPFYVELVITAAVANGSSKNSTVFVVLRVLRLFRVLRLLMAGKYVDLLGIVGETLQRSIAGLSLLVFSVASASLVFGSLVFYAENLTYCTFDEQQQVWLYDSGDASPFQSVLDAAWWAVVTLSTVGYGDAFPISPLGRVVAVITILAGLLVLAFPLTIISTHFADLSSAEEAVQLQAYSDDLAHQTAQLSDRELIEVLRSELAQQAKSLNELQTALDQA